MQCVHARTSDSVGVVISVSATGGIVSAVPRIAVTSGDGVTIVRTVIKGKIERYCTVAARRVGCSICRGVGGGIVCDSIPQYAVAGDDNIGRCVAVVNCEMQCVCAGTAIGVGIIMGIDTGGSICVPIPNVVFTCRYGIAVVRTVIEGKIECYCAVAACCVGGSVCRVIGDGIICSPIPCQTIASSDNVGRCVAVVDGQM